MSGGFSLIPNVSAKDEPKVDLCDSTRRLYNLSATNIEFVPNETNNTLLLQAVSNDVPFYPISVETISGSETTAITGCVTNFTFESINLYEDIIENCNFPVTGLSEIISTNTAKVTDPTILNNYIKNILVSKNLLSSTPKTNFYIDSTEYDVNEVTDFTTTINNITQASTFIPETTTGNISFYNISFSNVTEHEFTLNINSNLLNSNGALFHDTSFTDSYVTTNTSMQSSFNYLELTSIDTITVSNAGLYSISDTITISGDSITIDTTNLKNDTTADLVFSIKSTKPDITELHINTYLFAAVTNTPLTIRLKILKTSSGVTTYITN